MSPLPSDKVDSPPYVHRLMDALLRHEPLDFQGCDVPPDIQDRLLRFFDAHSADLARLEFPPDHAMHNLVSRLSAAVQAELGPAGLVLTAANDVSMDRLGMGILAKMQTRQIGWYRAINSNAYLFVPIQRYNEQPDDGERWIPVFAFGE